MKVNIVSGEGRNKTNYSFEYQNNESKRPMALDVLIQAKSTSMPELAFRYGCRNELCGVCTIEVNGQPRLACRCRVNENDTLDALSTLPLIRDMVVARDKVNKQLQRTIPPSSTNHSVAPTPKESSLNRCIECYGCLSDCPMHKRNDLDSTDSEEGFKYGNPYTLPKIKSAMLSPCQSESNKKQLLNKAINLGLDSCLNCDGCKCQVGISLTNEVIEPLLADAAALSTEF